MGAICSYLLLTPDPQCCVIPSDFSWQPKKVKQPQLFVPCSRIPCNLSVIKPLSFTVQWKQQQQQQWSPTCSDITRQPLHVQQSEVATRLSFILTGRHDGLAGVSLNSCIAHLIWLLNNQTCGFITVKPLPPT